MIFGSARLRVWVPDDFREAEVYESCVSGAVHQDVWLYSPLLKEML